MYVVLAVSIASFQQIGESNIMNSTPKTKVTKLDETQPLDLGLRFTNIIQLFQIRAKQYPDKIAARFADKKLSYRELDQRSNQIAKYLRKNGVQAEVVVGLSLDNGVDLILAIMGILKAGGVYLPVEPSYPKERIDFMLKDAKPVILITESSKAHQFIEFSGNIIQLDLVLAEISVCDDDPLNISIEPNHLAYIIYTSGSTGNPKGIMVEHHSLSHGAVAHQEFYEGELIGLLSSSISFDVSILIIFHLLLSGGTVCIPPSGSIVDAKSISDLIEKNSINYILCVPSLYSMLLNRFRKLPSLKIVSLTGENIPNSILILHPQLAPNAILYNEYGPTEYAIGTTIAKLYDPKEQKMYPVTIGKPLPNTHVYILDENLQPVLNTKKGEIFIGGMGVARGYINQPFLTAERFIPFQSTFLYRTGDFGRFLTNGNIEFLGRIDYQVKIHGNRVELGEVEHVINTYPKIDEAVVVVRENSNESKYLVAYFTALANSDIKQELKSHLANILPKYMIPSIFVQLESFSRTPNGKIDRNALPIKFENNEGSSKWLQSELEQTLLEIWKQVLVLEVIGNNANFFDIGGDSLGIARVQAQIEASLGIHVPITALFQYTTVSQLAQYISQQGNTGVSIVDQTRSDKQRAAFKRFKLKAR